MRAAMHNRGRIVIPPGHVFATTTARLNAQYGRGRCAKMSYTHRALNGKVIEIHYYMNLATRRKVEFKFKSW
jgi:hypothetical protein